MYMYVRSQLHRFPCQDKMHTSTSSWNAQRQLNHQSDTHNKKNKQKNKRTMMVLYRSPEQTALHTVEVSAKFTALRLLYNFIALLPSGHVFFYAS